MAKNKSKKAEITATVETVGVVVQAVEGVETGVQTETAPAATPVPVQGSKVDAYRKMNEEHHDIEVQEGDSVVAVPVTNKRAMVAALYCVVCNALGVKVTDTQTNVLRFVAKLLPYTNAGYSKQKGRILAGAEITASGMLQYARFMCKPEASKLLPGGELHARTVQATKAAEYIFNKHKDTEGYAGLAAQYAGSTSK